MRTKERVKAILESQLDLAYVSNSVVEDIIAAVYSNGSSDSGVSEEFVRNEIYEALSPLKDRLDELETQLGINR